MFGTAAIFTRSIAGISPIAIAASRLTLGLVFMGGLIGAQRHLEELKRSGEHYLLFILLGIISSLHFVLFVLAVQKTFIANALILVNTAPILVLLLVPVFLKESITSTDLASVAVTFTGAGIIIGFDKILFRPDYLLGDFCALGSAGCYALYAVLARKLRRIYSSAVIMFWFFGLGAMFLWIGGAVRHDQFFSSPSNISLLFLLLLGILPTGIGHFSYNLSLKYIPATKASTIVLVEPVSGTVFAWIFLSEIPPMMTFLGVFIVLIGIGMASSLLYSSISR
jgi:DME family drug/metabolite transporter